MSCVDCGHVNNKLTNTRKKCPPYLSCLFSFANRGINTHSATRRDLLTPKGRTVTGQRVFAFQGVHTFKNKLKHEILANRGPFLHVLPFIHTLLNIFHINCL